MSMGMATFCLGSEPMMTTTLKRSSRVISSSTTLSSCRISSSISFPHHQSCGKVRQLRISRVLTKEENQIQLDTSSGGGGGDFGNGGKGGGGGGDGEGDGDEGINNDDDFEKNNNNKKIAVGMSMSQKLTLGYAALVGVGGVMGYVKSGSQKSLTAGGFSALLLYYVFTQLPTRPAFASSLGFGISAALLVVMGSRFKSSGKIFPAGLVSVVSFVMTGGYLHGIMRGLH